MRYGWWWWTMIWYWIVILLAIGHASKTSRPLDSLFWLLSSLFAYVSINTEWLGRGKTLEILTLSSSYCTSFVMFTLTSTIDVPKHKREDPQHVQDLKKEVIFSPQSSLYSLWWYCKYVKKELLHELPLGMNRVRNKLWESSSSTICIPREVSKRCHYYVSLLLKMAPTFFKGWLLKHI